MRQITAQIEYLIYLYIFVCVCLMVFNTGFLLVRKSRKRTLEQRSEQLKKELRKQFGKEMSESYLNRLIKRLKKHRWLMAFDRAVSELNEESPEEMAVCLEQMKRIFHALAKHYRKAPDMEQAYYAFIVAKYCRGWGRRAEDMMQIMVGLTCSKSPYVRENALRALYSLGDPYAVIYSMILLNENHIFHHQKLLVDGMNSFTGSHELLVRGLWERFDRFAPELQVVIVDYMRYQAMDYRSGIAELLLNPKTDREVRLATLRYFRNRPYEPIRTTLYRYVQNVTIESWEEGALAATALGAFSDRETIRVLRNALTSQYWYLRFNSIEALQRIGIDEELEAEIVGGDDRYARELTQYKQAVHRMRLDTEGRA